MTTRPRGVLMRLFPLSSCSVRFTWTVERPVASASSAQYKTLEEGDAEAIKTAEAIGDDRLQRRSQCHVVPDSFTHGSSEQRVRWFMTGMKGGEIRQCDTFRESRL